MKKLAIVTVITATVFLALAAFPTWASERPAMPKERPSEADAAKVTVQQAIDLQTALRNLDGHLIIIKQNGQDGTVMVPWEFGDGRLRLRIANDLAIIDTAVKAANEAGKAVFQEVSKKFNVQELKAGTPERAEYDKLIAEISSAPAAGTQDLAKIKASELKLGKNEIAITVLEALGPILVDDEYIGH